MLPIIQQLHDANDDRDRAQWLLQCPDSVMLKYESAILAACRHFAPGMEFVNLRNAAMRSVRSVVGGLPGSLSSELDALRAEMAAYAAGAPISAL